MSITTLSLSSYVVNSSLDISGDCLYRSSTRSPPRWCEISEEVTKIAKVNGSLAPGVSPVAGYLCVEALYDEG